MQPAGYHIVVGNARNIINFLGPMLKLFETAPANYPLRRYFTVDLALQILVVGNLLALLLLMGHLKLCCNDLLELKLSVGRPWILVHFLELAHEFHVLEGVYLQLRQLVVEAPFANLDGFCNIRL